MDIINLKRYFLTKIMYWIFAAVLVEMAIVYLKLKLDDDVKTMIGGFSIVVGFLLAFYLNRSEPEVIKFDREYIEISYFKQPGFGKDRTRYAKNAIDALKKNGLIILSNEGVVVAKVRRHAVDAKDWETLQNYFD